MSSSPVPVPEGALLRYDSTTFGAFGENWSLGVIRNEDYNPEHHPDVLTDEADSKRDPIDHDHEIVEDRITWIKVCSRHQHCNISTPSHRLTHHQNAVTGKNQSCWSLRDPQAKQQIVLKAEIFMSTRTDIVDHQAAYERNSTVLKPGIVKFRTIEHTILNPSKLGWEKALGDNGEGVYQILTCVVIRISGDFVRFGFKVIPAGEEPVDGKLPDFTTTRKVTDQCLEEGHLVIEPDDSKILWADNELQEIWNRKFSHVAQESDPSIVSASISATPVAKKQKKDLPMAPLDPTTPEGSDDEIPY